MPKRATYFKSRNRVAAGERLERQRAKARPTAAERGYDAAWRKARLDWLAEHPLCVMCSANGAITMATVVDHIKPHKGDQALFWDRGNWQSLCKPHHDQKTARDDGAFGRDAGPPAGCF